MPRTSTPAKHLYGRGWFGLIPMVGAFVGIGLLILGIFKYNDKKLSYIGLFATLPTILIYGGLYYFMMFSDAGAKQFASTSQMVLNDLVKNIEFYKTINGNYPDSLEELKYTLGNVMINDPILLRRPGKKNTTFNYKKIGDKYTLFSSGIDKIPKTNDDIYPHIFIPDSSKFGLIKIK